MTAPAAPPTPKSPLELLRGGTVREVVEHVRQRRVSARDMVDACIAEVERVNPTLNAVVATRFDEARAEAEAIIAADALLQQPEHRLLQEQIARFWASAADVS